MLREGGERDEVGGEEKGKGWENFDGDDGKPETTVI